MFDKMKCSSSFDTTVYSSFTWYFEIALMVSLLNQDENMQNMTVT